MTETTTAATKATTAKHSASPFGVPNYKIPAFDLPKMEMPEAFSQIAGKGVAQAKDTYEKAKAAVEQAADLLKDTCGNASKDAADYNLKVIDVARTNTNIAFDYAHELLGVKSPAEFAEVSTAYARKQFEVMTAQTKELTELAQKVTTKIAEPLKAGVTKAFNNKLT
jgi:phasin